MTRSQVVYIALGLALLVFLAVIAIGPGRYKALAEARLLAAINQGPVKIRLDQSQLNLTSLSAIGAKIFVPSIWSEFYLEQVYAQLNPLSVLTLTPHLSFQAKLWGGTIDLSGQHSLLSGNNNASLNLRELNLSELQQLDALGFEGGKLWLESDGLTLSSEKFSGILNLKLIDLQHPSDKIVSGALFGSPAEIVIPKITDLNLQASIVLAPLRVEIKQITFESSLGKSTGNVVLQLSAMRKVIGSSGEFEFVLSSDGATIFNLGRQFLESSGKAKSNSNSLTAKHWRVTFEAMPRPRYDFIALD